MPHIPQPPRSFAIETTCAGKSYVPILKRCKADGWTVTLYYLWLPSSAHSHARVAQRVREGGHSKNHLRQEFACDRCFPCSVWSTDDEYSFLFRLQADALHA